MSAFEDAVIQRIKRLEREVERLQRWERPIGGEGGVTDHGDLTGLLDDDHPQYLRNNITLTAGLGLTGGGDLSANRRFDVGAGDGITVGEDTVSVDLNYNFTWMGVHSFQNITYASSIMPHISDVYDLGSSASLWRNIWASELSAIVFAQYTQVLLGGWFTVSKGEGVLEAAVSTSATSILLDSSSVDIGDIIVFRGLSSTGNPQVEYMKITGKSGTTYSVTRNLDGSGANAWPAGSVYANYGTTGNGRIELNAYDTPRISVFSHANTIAGYREQVRIGDLINGWGYSTSTYGSAFGAYESGKANITIDPTNGVRIRNYNQTIIQLTGTEASFENVIKLGTYGRLQQGTGTWGSNFTGSAIWNESGVMNIGGWNNNVKQWWGGSDGKFYANNGKFRIGADGTFFGLGELNTSDHDGLILFTNHPDSWETNSNVALNSTINNDGTWLDARWYCINKALNSTAIATILASAPWSAGSRLPTMITAQQTSEGSEIRLWNADKIVFQTADYASDGDYVYVLKGMFAVQEYISARGLRILASSGVLSATNPGAGNLVVDGTIKDGNGVEYSKSTHNHTGTYLPINGTAADSDKLDGYDSTDFGRPVFLTTPKTSTSWDGDARSTTSATKIDTSAVFGIPDGVKALIVRVLARDSASFPNTSTYFQIGPASSANNQIRLYPVGGDIMATVTGICNCDANGDIYYSLASSGTGTMDVWLEIWGYWL